MLRFADLPPTSKSLAANAKPPAPTATPKAVSSAIKPSTAAEDKNIAWARSALLKGKPGGKSAAPATSALDKQRGTRKAAPQLSSSPHSSTNSSSNTAAADTGSWRGDQKPAPRVARERTEAPRAEEGIFAKFQKSKAASTGKCADSSSAPSSKPATGSNSDDFDIVVEAPSDEEDTAPPKAAHKNTGRGVTKPGDTRPPEAGATAPDRSPRVRSAPDTRQRDLKSEVRQHLAASEATRSAGNKTPAGGPKSKAVGGAVVDSSSNNNSKTGSSAVKKGESADADFEICAPDGGAELSPIVKAERGARSERATPRRAPADSNRSTPPSSPGAGRAPTAARHANPLGLSSVSSAAPGTAARPTVPIASRRVVATVASVNDDFEVSGPDDDHDDGQGIPTIEARFKSLKLKSGDKGANRGDQDGDFDISPPDGASNKDSRRGRGHPNSGRGQSRSKQGK